MIKEVKLYELVKTDCFKDDFSLKHLNNNNIIFTNNIFEADILLTNNTNSKKKI